MKINKTNDYNRFVFVKGNREVKHVKKVKAAMEQANLMDLFPVVCSIQGKKLKVLDGQGRVEAAKALGLPVSYVVSNKLPEEMIGKVNSVQTSWSTQNYVNWYADNGSAAYVKLRSFIKETGIPITVAVQLITGSISDGGISVNCMTPFKNGDLELNDLDHAYKVAGVINVLKKHGIKHATHRSLVVALSRLCKTSVFNPAKLDQKLEYQSSRLIKCADYMQYITLIDDIYNYRVSPSNITSLVQAVKQNGQWTN